MEALTSFYYQAVDTSETVERKDASEPHILELTTPELKRSPSLRRADKYDKAASRICDALDGVLRPQPQDGKLNTLCYHLHLTMHPLVKAVVAALLLVTFFERPAWCEGEKNCECVWIPEDETACPYPTFDVTYLGPGIVMTLEVAFLVVIFLHQSLLRVAFGTRNYYLSTHAFELSGAVALAATLVVTAGGSARRRVLFVPLCRLWVFVAYSDDVKSQLRVVARIIPHYLRVGALLALLTLFFGWFGVVLFPTDEQTGEVGRYPSEGDAYFPNLREGMWSLMVLVTTANFPDVALPGYARCRWSMLFFIAYLLLCLFFLMNLLLATVYNVYQEEQDKAKEICEANRLENLSAAYDLLTQQPLSAPHQGYTTTGLVDPMTLRAVFAELNQHRDVRYINDERSEFLLSSLDATASTQINFDGFQKICSMLQLDEKDDDDDDDDDGQNPFSNDNFRSRLASFVASPVFEYGVDFLVLVNAIAVAVQTRDEILGHKNRRSEDSDGLGWEIIETGLAFFYLMEMAVKLYAHGKKKYFKYTRNQFDFIVTLASTVTTVVVFYPNAYDDSRLIRYVLMIRLARLVRVLEAIPDFQVIGESFLNMLPAAGRLLKFLFCATFLAAVIGMALFGGLINTGPNLPDLQATSTFYASGYAPLNFNDLFSAYVTLFCILVS